MGFMLISVLAIRRDRIRKKREELGQARREGEVGAKEEIKGLLRWISTLEVRILCLIIVYFL